MFVEREYQTKAEAAIFEDWLLHQSTLLELATGLGKTKVAASIIKRMQPKRAMFLAHRTELISQAKETIEQHGVSVGIEKANLYADTGLFTRQQCVVSSIQTQISGPSSSRRYQRFNPKDFGLLIVDEVHHGTAPSWKEVIGHYLKNENLRVLGLSATPKRSDGEALKQILESVAFRYGILDGINDGWLVDIAQQFVSVKSLDFSHIKTTCGDLNEGELSKLMETEENIQGVCQPTLEVMFALPPKTLSTVDPDKWREYLSALNRKPRRTLFFTVSVAQAQVCASVFGRAMDGVEWVCGTTNAEKRLETVNRFSSGETSIVANCGIFLEGYNNPFVELISVARPTKSTQLYLQMLGRGTRTLPGAVDGILTSELRRKAIESSPKPILRVLDFVGNSGKHKLVSTIDVLGGHVSSDAIALARKKAMEGKAIKILKTMSLAEKTVQDQKKERLEMERKEEEARKQRLLAKVDYQTKDVSPFDYGHDKLAMASVCSKDGKPFTENQARVLRELGCDPNRLTHRQARAILGTKPRPRQLAVLTKHGYDTKGLTFKQCIALIDELKANGWKKKAA